MSAFPSAATTRQLAGTPVGATRTDSDPDSPLLLGEVFTGHLEAALGTENVTNISANPNTAHVPIPAENLALSLVRVIPKKRRGWQGSSPN